MIQYRRLEKHELTPELFQDFIRHQTVQDCYRKREGRWVIEPAPFIDDWSREEYDFLVQCLKNTAPRKYSHRPRICLMLSNTPR